jgi:hypothetical protein
MGFVLDIAALEWVSPATLVSSAIPLIALQSSPSIIQGWYNRLISGSDNSGLGSIPAQYINEQPKVRDDN